MERRSGPGVPDAATEAWKRVFSGRRRSNPVTDTRKRGQVSTKDEKEVQWDQGQET